MELTTSIYFIAHYALPLGAEIPFGYSEPGKKLDNGASVFV